MKSSVATLALAAALVVAVPESRAQVFVQPAPSNGAGTFVRLPTAGFLTPPATQYVEATYPGSYVPPAGYHVSPSYSMYGSYDPVASFGYYVPPYSYYAAPYPYPARYYVGYGGDGNFPYYGRPYGYRYDPWTWPYLSTYPYAALARYYHPPLG